MVSRFVESRAQTQSPISTIPEENPLSEQHIFLAGFKVHSPVNARTDCEITSPHGQIHSKS